MSLGIDYKAVGGIMTVRGDGAAEWDFGWSAKDVPADPQTARLAAVAPDLLAADDDKTVLFWKNEERVLGKLLDCWNQQSIGSCFPAGTLVRMADGSHKPIERLLMMDEVQTAEGRTGRVTHLFARPHRGDVCRLVLWGHSHLRATPEHPILTRRGYVPVGTLQEGDWVALPVAKPEARTHVITAEHIGATVYVGNGGERKSVYRGVAGRAAAAVTYYPVPETIELTPEAGFIFGMFLAEGSTDRARLVFTFNANEEHTCVAELLAALKSTLGVEGRIQRRGHSKTIKVIVYGRKWAQLFESLCSTGAGDKRLHPDLAGGPVEFRRELLRGWLTGDGYAGRRAIPDQGVTVSHSLALDMYAIASELGMRPAVVRSEPKPSRGVKHRRVRWDVKLHSQDDNYRVETDGRHVWRKVRRVDRESFDGFVFNCEVEGDNSYVAEGVGVHNCVSHGWGRGVQDLMLHEIAAGEPEEWPGAEVCREAIYGGSRVEVGGGRIRGDGSVGEWAAKWVKNWGIILYAKYGSVDLTDGYRVDRCRKWGDSGCPDALEPEAKKHPVTDVALVMTAAEAWAAVGGGKPVAVCSDVGYDSPLVEGFCRRSGSWAHCMVVRGRFLHPTRGKSFVIGNSWGDYLAGRGDPTVRTADAGDVRLPPGSFAVTAADLESMLRQQDSYAMAGLTGWRKTRVDHTP